MCIELKAKINIGDRAIFRLFNKLAITKQPNPQYNKTYLRKQHYLTQSRIIGNTNFRPKYSPSC